MINWFRLFVLTIVGAAVYVTYFADNEDAGERDPRALLKKRGLSPGTVTLSPVNDLYVTGFLLTVSWSYPPGSADPPVKSINIDLYDASTADHFFVRQLVNGLSPSTKSYQWQIPVTVPTSATYTLRVWGQYTNQQPNNPDYWRLADTAPFAVSRYPVGVAANSGQNGLQRGQTLNSKYFVDVNKVNSSVPMTLVLQNYASSNSALKQGIILRNDIIPDANFVGYYSWFVHSVYPDSKLYRLRLSGVLNGDGKTAFDESSAVAVNGDLSKIAITMSVSASSFAAGTFAAVTMSQKDQTNQNVPLQTTNYQVYLSSADATIPLHVQPRLITLSSLGGFNYQFQVPSDVPNGQYYLFLVADNGPTSSAKTGAFQVTGGVSVQASSQVEITEPGASVSIAASSTLNIQWKPVSGAITVYLVWNDGSNSLYAGTIAANLYQTSFKWLVPAALTAGSQYRIRVCAAVNPLSVICNESPNFTITNTLISEPVSRVLDDGSGTSVYGGPPGSGPKGDEPTMPSGASALRPFKFF